jgi:hypothetical protein
VPSCKNCYETTKTWARTHHNTAEAEEYQFHDFRCSEEMNLFSVNQDHNSHKHPHKNTTIMKIGRTTHHFVMVLWAMPTSSWQATASTGTTRIAGYQTKSKVTGVSDEHGFFLFPTTKSSFPECHSHLPFLLIQNTI